MSDAMTNTARDAFLRRYATSPIHVPRLERLLAVYEDDAQDDAFCGRFIAWDRACPDGEAARIVTEVLSAVVASGQRTRLDDDAVRGAIRWMSEVTSITVAERAQVLRDGLTSEHGASASGFAAFLGAADGLDAARFAAAAASMVLRLETPDPADRRERDSGGDTREGG